MASYDEWLENAAQCARAWFASDFDRLDVLERDDPGPDELARHVATFCERSGELPQRLGEDATGDLIWYLMGTGRQVWLDCKKATPPFGHEAVASLEHLYGELFAKHLLDPSDATQNVSRRLGTACYMLWDMDGGLQWIATHEQPPDVANACFAVLEHALTLDSPPCWLSALHGLGHIAFNRSDLATPLIDDFLRRWDDRIPDDLRAYALSARRGYVL